MACRTSSSVTPGSDKLTSREPEAGVTVKLTPEISILVDISIRRICILEGPSNISSEVISRGTSPLLPNKLSKFVRNAVVFSVGS